MLSRQSPISLSMLFRSGSECQQSGASGHNFPRRNVPVPSLACKLASPPVIPERPPPPTCRPPDDNDTSSSTATLTQRQHNTTATSPPNITNTHHLPPFTRPRDRSHNGPNQRAPRNATRIRQGRQAIHYALQQAFVFPIPPSSLSDSMPTPTGSFSPTLLNPPPTSMHTSPHTPYLRPHMTSHETQTPANTRANIKQPTSANSYVFRKQSGPGF